MSSMSSSLFDLSGRTALVTGAGSGIGRAVAQRLACLGTKVALVGRNQKTLRTVSEEIGQAGGTAYAIPCDVGKANAVIKLAEVTGSPDIVVHAAAGIEPIVHFFDASVTDWLAAYNNNVHSVYLCIRTFVPRMPTNGTFVALTSVARHVYSPGESLYSSSKSAAHIILQYARKEALEGAPRLVTFDPGAAATPLQAAIQRAGLAPEEEGEIAAPDRVARAISWICATAELPSLDLHLRDCPL